MPTTTTRREVIDKVRNILARADRTTFDGERENAIGLAKKIIEKHGLDKYDVGPLCYLVGMGDDPATEARRQSAFDDAMRMMHNMNRSGFRYSRTQARRDAEDFAARARQQARRDTPPRTGRTRRSGGARPWKATWIDDAGQVKKASFATEANARQWAGQPGFNQFHVYYGG